MRSSANFEKARDILSACEADVRRNYPYIHAAAKSGVTPAYPGGTWGDSIRRMMGIRALLEPLIKANDAVLKDIDRKLSGI